VHNVSICVRAGLPKPRAVPDSERTKDTKTLDYASTPLDANTLCAPSMGERYRKIPNYSRECKSLIGELAKPISKSQGGLL
jgi:hypothetical protein